MASIREQLRSFTRREQFHEISFGHEALDAAKGTDIEEDAPVLYAITEYLEPKVIVELGTRQAISTRIFDAARGDYSLLFAVDPVDCSQYLQGVTCNHIIRTGEEFFREFDGKADLLFIDTDPHTFEQTTVWMRSWVEQRLAPGGVAIFHDVHPAREEIRVREAVESWLGEASQQDKGWTWRVLLPERALPVFNGGLGILWAP